uniref:DDE Tnp4 domain-containing protein n=2 Tax=Anopheles atroparvus TaxID=41427 RepID=A0AAG5CVI3_ANOAO
MRRRLAKRAMMKRNAGIMKIHSYSTSPPHEEVNSRTANSNRRKTQEQQEQQQQQGNGVDSSERRRQEQQQQRQLRPTRNSSTTKNPHNPELGSTANRLAVRRTQGQEEETLLDDGEETAEEVVVEEAEEEEADDDDGGEEEDEELAPSAVKRPRLDQQQQQQKAKSVVVGAAAAKVTSAGRPGVKVTPRRIKQEVVELVDEQEHEPDEPTLQFVHLATGGNQQQLLQEEEEQEGDEEEEVVDGGEEDEEDDGTSSSTASAEEEIGIEMEPQQLQLQKGGSRTAIVTGGRVQLSRGSAASVGRGTTTTTTTILMTEEDYEQHQQEQEEQQQQHGDDEDVAMDDYEGAVAGASAPGGSEDMEDTDGALTGNRLFRKKVKRKVHTRTNSASVASGSLIGSVGTNSITSSKGKLQMLQEFPTLFIGLRRNRMFLVNSLAQSFDLNQRDIVLTLRKIKQNESSARLANFFGIGAAEVDLLFHTSVPKIADCLRNFIVWPDDFTMKLNVPVSLRQHFNRIHLILNYLVLRVKQNAVQQLPAGEVGLAYCPVDQCHKLKYLVASTLDGCVCFVSRAFGVQTDDEQLLAQSGFLTKFKTNTNLIAGQNFHNFEDRLANGHDHSNNNGGGGGRNRRSRAAGTNDDDDSDLERVLGNCDEDNFEDIVSEKISKSRTFKLKNYIENILENFQNHQMLSPHTCIDGRTFKLLDDIVVIVGALINLQKQEID